MNNAVGDGLGHLSFVLISKNGVLPAGRISAPAINKRLVWLLSGNSITTSLPFLFSMIAL